MACWNELVQLADLDVGELHSLAVAVCESLPGAELTQPFGPDADVYKVGDKMFALLSEMNRTPGINLKIPPEDGEALRSVSYIEAGYHMNKKHWITVSFVEATEPGLLTELIEDSYELVRSALPRNARLALDGDR